MPWPMSQDYNEAIQSPASSFADPELRGGQPVTNAMGMPMPRSGNFADVYEFIGASGTKWAVKCFTREVAGLQERYTAISRHLAQAKLPFTVDFTYLQQGIRIRGQWFPILKMQWVEGQLLNEFVRNHLDRPALLKGLVQIWLRMAIALRDGGMAHADLQHGNVILVPGPKAGLTSVRLVDYDGMWLPALARTPSGELGHSSYQHPQRAQRRLYNAELDRLPVLVIACALRGLAVGGQALWNRYDNGDNLLFRESDLRKPATSPLFKELWNLADATVHDLVGFLILGITGDPDHVPLAARIFAEDRTFPLNPVQEQFIATILGPGAKVVREVSAATTPLPLPIAVPVAAPPPLPVAVPVKPTPAAPPPASAWAGLEGDPALLIQPKRVKGGLVKTLVRAGILLVLLAVIIGAGRWASSMLRQKQAGEQPAPIGPVAPNKADDGKKGVVAVKNGAKDAEAVVPVAKGNEFEPLFNGIDLTGWKTAPNQHEDWRVVKGTLTASSPLSILYTCQEFQDFHLRLEACRGRAGGANVFFRLDGAKKNHYHVHIDDEGIGNLCRMQDFAKGVKLRSGNKPAMGEWTTLNIIVDNGRLNVIVNDKEMADLVIDGEVPNSGLIGMRVENESVEFRKIEIKKLNVK